MIVYGSFVPALGPRQHPDAEALHASAFGVDHGEFGLRWDGSAWNSFWTTMQIATISAPLTAAVGLLTAWLLTRQSFAASAAFEFGTMLSFAIPGTVIGVSYIIAFNVPPIELTGTGGDPGDLLRVPQHAGRRARGHRVAVADRQEPRRSLADAARQLLAHAPPRHRCRCSSPAILSALVYSFVRTR
jgi:iron(III) transport system permease protein